MIEEIFKYKKVTKSIFNEINNSPIRMEHIIKQSGIPTASFYRKLKASSFTPDEMIQILIVIKPEEARKYDFQLLLKEGLEDIEKGNTISHEEMKRRINEKFDLDI